MQFCQRRFWYFDYILSLKFVLTSWRSNSQLEQLERLHSEILPVAPWLPTLGIYIRSKVKTRQSQSYKFKKIAKNSNFKILQETLHATHLLKLLDKMCKYEMDPTRSVGTTERTRDAGRCGTDRRTDRVKPIYPQTTSGHHLNQVENGSPPDSFLVLFMGVSPTTFPLKGFTGKKEENIHEITCRHCLSHWSKFHWIIMQAAKWYSSETSLTEAKWCHMVTHIWVNIGSGNGLLPDGTKPLPAPMLTSH